MLNYIYSIGVRIYYTGACTPRRLGVQGIKQINDLYMRIQNHFEVSFLKMIACIV